MLVLFTLLIVFGVSAFMLENQQPVALVFLGWSLPQLPVSVFILLALIVGLIVGPMLTFFARFRMKSNKRPQ
ncbi:hypothetical protein D3C76_1687820 [compost metagenome]